MASVYGLSAGVTDDIIYPRTQIDSEYMTYMASLRKNVAAQKADVQQRLARMAEHAETTEVARQLKILHSVQANREPSKDDLELTNRRPGWLQIEQLPRVNRVGDKDEPTWFPKADDIQGRNQYDKQNQMTANLANSLPLGTSRFKNGDLVEGSQDRSDISRPVGIRFPALARETPKFVNQPQIMNMITGQNRSDLTASVHRSEDNGKKLRSDKLFVDFTGPQQNTSNQYSKTGNLVAKPSFTLRADNSGNFGDKFKAGGVSQTKRGGFQPGKGTFADDKSTPVELPPSFILQKPESRDAINAIKFKDDNKTQEAETLAQINKYNGPQKARLRDDEFTFTDDTQTNEQVKADRSDKQKLGWAQPGLTTLKDYDLDMTGQEARAANAGLIFRQATKPLQADMRLNMDDDMELYKKSQTASKVATTTTERPDLPKTTRDMKEKVDTTGQVLNVRPMGYKSGNAMHEAQETTVQRKQTDMSEQQFAGLGGHSLSMQAPSKMQADFTMTRNDPDVTREMIRVQGTPNTKPLHELDVHMQGRSDQVGVDMRVLGGSAVGSSVVDRTTFTPVGTTDDNNGVPQVRPTRTITTREMLLMKQQQQR